MVVLGFGHMGHKEAIGGWGHRTECPWMAALHILRAEAGALPHRTLLHQNVMCKTELMCS